MHFQITLNKLKTLSAHKQSNTLDGPLQPCKYVNYTKMWNLLNHFQDVSNAA